MQTKPTVIILGGGTPPSLNFLGGNPGTGAEIPLQTMGKTMASQVVPLQALEDHGGTGGCLKEAVIPWRAHTGAGSWQDLWTHAERSPCWSRFAGRTCDPVGDPCWSTS